MEGGLSRFTTSVVMDDGGSPHRPAPSLGALFTTIFVEINKQAALAVPCFFVQLLEPDTKQAPILLLVS